jgi:hypothetical protein
MAACFVLREIQRAEQAVVTLCRIHRAFDLLGVEGPFGFDCRAQHVKKIVEGRGGDIDAGFPGLGEGVGLPCELHLPSPDIFLVGPGQFLVVGSRRVLQSLFHASPWGAYSKPSRRRLAARPTIQ